MLARGREGGGEGGGSHSLARSEATLPPKSALRIIFLDFAVAAAAAVAASVSCALRQHLLLPPVHASLRVVSRIKRGLSIVTIIAHSSHRRSFFPSLRRRPLRPIRRWCYCWVSLSKQVLRNAVDFLRVLAPPRIMHRATAAGCFKFIVFYPLSCQVRFGVDQVVGLVMWKKYHCMKMSFCS